MIHRTRPIFIALALGLTLLGTPRAEAREDATAAVFADHMSFNGAVLTARGAVDVTYGDIRLSATRLTYNRSTDQLTIDGPIRLTEANGNTVVLASDAEISADLRNGILRSARIVIDEQLQLAADQLERLDGRYTRMSRTVASACEICANRPTPLWEIRAREVIHDADTRQLYFDNAQFRLMGLPILWLPHLRIPDPTLERARGFLIPKISTDSTLGTGIEIPYFIPIGDHRDVTLTPYIATNTNTLKLRYRQAFTNGSLEINGAASRDETRDGTRAYLFADGEWDIWRGLTFGLDLRAVSDIAYLVDYGISDEDYLPSRITLSRYSEGEALDTQFIYLRSLRDEDQDDDSTIPMLLAEGYYERSFDTVVPLPGRLSFGLSTSASYRESDADETGYDVLRLGAESEWATSAIFGPGLRLDATVAGYLDGYAMQQNAAYNDTALRFTPLVETRLSYPLRRTTQSGASELIEPVVQLGWSETFGSNVPNIDSTLVEFDEGNLFALSRFPGADRRETGLSAAIGLRFAHEGTNLRYGLTLGRVIALEDHADYSASSGLDGRDSDWLLAAGVHHTSGLSLTSRALFDDAFDMTKFETRAALTKPRYDLATSYTYLIKDAAEDRAGSVDELRLDAGVQLTDQWRAEVEYLYDFTENEATRAGLVLEFLNECTKLRLKATRRFTETDALAPTTSVGFSVGFGAFAKSGGVSRKCGF